MTKFSSRTNIAALLLLVWIHSSSVECFGFLQTSIYPIKTWPVSNKPMQHQPFALRLKGRLCVTSGIKQRRVSTSNRLILFGTDGESEPEKPIGQPKSKVPATTFNLIKAIVGSGVLALPAGVAAVSDSKASLLPAIGLMVFLGILSTYTFGLYGRLLHFSQAKSLGEVWEKEKGKSTAWIPSVASMIFCFGAALSYVILLGDVFSSLASTSGLSGISSCRAFWILLVTSTILFPLCNISSLLALAPLSVFGVFAIISTVCFLGWRCPSLNGSSPYAAAGGALLKTLKPEQMPMFGTYSKGFASPSAMVLTGMAATAYLGHFSVPGMYHSLKGNGLDVVDRGSRNLADFFKVTVGGFAISILINCLVMAFGFLTFGGNSSGVILNNFSNFDQGASICRLLMAVCVIGGFPFLVSACKEELIGLWRLTGKFPGRSVEKPVTTVLISFLFACALILKDAGVVIGFIGSVMGSPMIYIFPSMLFLKHTATTELLSKQNRLERLFCRFLIVFGALVTLVGGTVSVLNGYFPHLVS